MTSVRPYDHVHLHLYALDVVWVINQPKQLQTSKLTSEARIKSPLRCFSDGWTIQARPRKWKNTSLLMIKQVQIKIGYVNYPKNGYRIPLRTHQNRDRLE